MKLLFRITGSALALSIIAAAVPGGAVAQENAAEPRFFTIDDGEIKTQIQKGLEELREFGTGSSTKTLIQQLKDRRHCDLKLAGPEKAPSRLTPTEIYQRARKATLVIGHLYQCDKCTKWHPSLAGAVVIDPSGIAVTNYHVMDKPKAGVFGARSSDGRIFPVVEVLAASPKDDLAIIRLSGGPFDAVPMSAGDPVGTEIKVISHPDGRFYSFSEGVIARYFRDPKDKTPRLQITADYARGSSGCGVFNEAGELTGIVASTNSIYYTETGDHQENLQMVVKSCIPVSSLRGLIPPRRSNR